MIHICSDLHVDDKLRMQEACCESCPDTLETLDHILFQCPLARRLWMRLGVNPTSGSSTTTWLVGMELSLPASIQYDANLVVFWHLWKAWNTLIFAILFLMKKLLYGSSSATWTCGAAGSNINKRKRTKSLLFCFVKCNSFF